MPSRRLYGAKKTTAKFSHRPVDLSELEQEHAGSFLSTRETLHTAMDSQKALLVDQDHQYESSMTAMTCESDSSPTFENTYTQSGSGLSPYDVPEFEMKSERASIPPQRFSLSKPTLHEEGDFVSQHDEATSD